MLTLVWGPPGSGKTYFLAASICRLLITAHAQGVACRILVTAYTHDAINLLLSHVQRRLSHWWRAGEAGSQLGRLTEGTCPRVIKFGDRAGKVENSNDGYSIRGTIWLVILVWRIMPSASLGIAFKRSSSFVS